MNRRAELKQLIAAVGKIGDMARRAPIVLKGQVEKLLATQERPGADIQPRRIAACADRFVPGAAVVDHILRLCGGVDTFHIAPKTDAGRKTNCIGKRSCFLAVLLAKRLTRGLQSNPGTAGVAFSSLPDRGIPIGRKRSEMEDQAGRDASLIAKAKTGMEAYVIDLNEPDSREVEHVNVHAASQVDSE